MKIQGKFGWRDCNDSIVNYGALVADQTIINHDQLRKLEWRAVGTNIPPFINQKKSGGTKQMY